jgi:hypothetical protein
MMSNELSLRGKLTASPRRICIKFRNRLDPLRRFTLAIRVETGDLIRQPSSHGSRTGVGNHEKQLAHYLGAPTPHHLHPLG